MCCNSWGCKELDTTEQLNRTDFLSYAAAAAAKSLQSCPTLCDPTDSSPSGSSIPGIIQARTLEWVVISFCNAWKWKVKVTRLTLFGFWLERTGISWGFLVPTHWNFWVAVFQHSNLWCQTKRKLREWQLLSPESPSRCTFFLPFRVFLHLFYIEYSGFSVVLSGRNRGKYIYIFWEEGPYFISITMLMLILMYRMCQKDKK